MNARPERYCEYESNTRTTQGNSVDFWTGLPIPGGDTRITQDDNVRSTQITGEPPGGLDNTPGTSFLVPGNDLLGPDQGLPCGFDQIPQTGPLPPYLISVNWVPASGSPVNWVNNFGGVVGWESTIPSISNVMD